MKITIKILPPLMLFIGIILLQSCGKEEPQIDPRKAILGKWEMTYQGNGDNLIPIENPSTYDHYFPDSLMLIYRYDLQNYSSTKYKYWFTDSLLIQSFVFIDNIDKDTIEFKLPYQYEFITPDKLKLEFQYSAIFNTFIYKRID